MYKKNEFKMKNLTEYINEGLFKKDVQFTITLESGLGWVPIYDFKKEVQKLIDSYVLKYINPAIKRCGNYIEEKYKSHIINASGELSDRRISSPSGLIYTMKADSLEEVVKIFDEVSDIFKTEFKKLKDFKKDECNIEFLGINHDIRNKMDEVAAEFFLSDCCNNKEYKEKQRIGDYDDQGVAYLYPLIRLETLKSIIK